MSEEPSQIHFQGRRYTLDERGFLDPPEQWDDVFAEGMAEHLGIYGGLTPEHWEFIRYLRRKFVDEKTVPLVVYACADNHLKLSRLNFLFPTGYIRGACRIAGINYQFMYENNPWLTYESYAILESKYKLAESGFLESDEQWDEQFARIVASEWQLPEGVTQKHWQIIHYLRDCYRDTGTIPSVLAACKANGIDVEELIALFPDGYRQGACRMAGLPFFG